MKIVLALILKDLRRDWKRPWSILLFTSMPLLMTVLLASVFGGGNRSAALPVIQVAILDQDKDMLTGMLRSMPSQGEAAKRLRLHFVENREEGVRMLEKRKASAFVVLPKNLTEDLLNGRTNTIELYENPAEQILPKVVREGVSLLAVGLSGAAEILGEPLKDVRKLFRAGDFPAEVAVTGAAALSIRKLEHLRTYLFPPLIQFETVRAGEFRIGDTNTPPATPTP